MVGGAREEGGGGGEKRGEKNTNTGRYIEGVSRGAKEGVSVLIGYSSV